MNKVKETNKWIATFFLAIFFPTLFPINVLYASNNGPNAPEAQSFEPVNATDMVNLASGDMSYVLPVMDVNGFPVTLSYHGGVPLDLESSWVGLGWNLNTGAINRNTNATPDDWKGGNSLDFIRYRKSDEIYNLNVGVGISQCAEVGVGMSWGSNKGVTGSVYGTLSLYGYAGVSGSIDTRGNYGVGLFGGYSSGGMTYGGGLGVSGNVNGGETEYSVGAGVKTSGGLTIGLSTSLTGNGTTFSMGYSNQSMSGLSGSGSASLSTSSFSQGDWDVQSKGWYVPVQIYCFTVGFGKRKIKYTLEKSYSKKGYGTLYSDSQANASDAKLADNVYNDYQNRFKYADSYDQTLPQSEKEFVGDYDLEREKLNFTYAGYDAYDVNATGISGVMKPKLLDNATLYGMGYIGDNASTSDETKQRVYYHNGNVSRRTFGTNTSTDIEFYFNGQFTENRTVSSLVPTYNGSSIENNLTNTLSARSVLNNDRIQQGNFVEVFTNEQIRLGQAAASGLLNPNNISSSQRTYDRFIKDGIGGYKITAPDGKVYHFSLPVYHYEQVQRTIYKDNTEENVSEKRQYTPYATHWLLTAITGPDYFDVNGNRIADEADFGYWIRLDHGKWSDGYVWRNPTDKKLKDYMTNIKGDIGSKDFGFYNFGRKQLYYLDKIVSPTQTAYFVKDLRYDSVGCDLNYFFRGTSSLPDDGLNGGYYAVESDFTYKRQLQLMLKSIVLVNNKDATQFEQNINNGNNPLHLNTSGLTDYVDNYTINFSQGFSENSSNILINQEQNVVDVKDFENFDYSKAIKVVEFNHNYNLAVKDHAYTADNKLSNGSPGVIQNNVNNPNHGKLTLKSIKFLGRDKFDYMPPYQFEYNGEFKNANQPYFAYPANPIVQKTNLMGNTDIPIKNIRAKDDWGFSKDRPEAWTLTTIKTPTGSSIDFEHEEDDYYTEAFSRRWWSNGLQFNINSVDSQTFDIVINKDPLHTYNADEDFSFLDYFSVGDVAFFDFFLCTVDEDWDFFTGCDELTNRIDINSQGLAVSSVSSNTLVFRISKSYIVQGQNTEDIYDTLFTLTNGFGDPYISSRGSCPNPDNCHDGFNLVYKLLASKVPKDQTGGGLRVKSITLRDENNNRYKTSYCYNIPGTNKVKNVGNYKSSGITSYSPVKGTKYIPYQSELPSPGVMYEYVTLTAENQSAQTLGETRYRFYVLRPVVDIFRPDIEMKYDDGTMMFKADVLDYNTNNGYFNPDANKKIKAKALNVKVNTSLIGQFRSVEEFNSKGQLMSKVEKNYLSGEALKALADLPNSNINKIHRGSIKESFQSMKSIYTSNSNDENPVLKERLMSISSKEDFASVLESTISVSPHGKIIEKYSNTDPMTGTFNTIETTTASGFLSKIERVPAYSKYHAMGSKTVNPSNKNMLTQEAMSIRSVKKPSGVWRAVAANITTWNDTWTYRNEISGTDNVDNVRKVWRKYKSFTWKENVGADGAFTTTISNANSQFDWLTNTPLSDKWQKLSEITRYTRWSLPIETKDINGNFASTKMADNNSKVLVSGNARYTEMYYSGAEFVKTGNLFDGEVKGAQFRTEIAAHTGEYSVKATSLTDNVFEVNGSSGGTDYYTNAASYTSTFRPGKYKVSFWVYKAENEQGLLPVPVESNGMLLVNDVQIPVSEIVNAGCWQQMNFYFDIPANNQNNTVVVRAQQMTGKNFFDDFRMHPVASSISGFVYDLKTDELVATLDGNNLGYVFKYDKAGRVKAKYAEIVDEGSIDGGFKILGQYKQNYKGVTVTEQDLPATIDNCYNTFIPLSVDVNNECLGSFENRFKTIVTGGSGNFSYEYKWLTNFQNQTYTNYTSGTDIAFIPYVPKYCNQNQYDKAWKFIVRVTDLNTNETQEKSYSYNTADCLYQISGNRWADMEISNCSTLCSPEEYVFRVHLKDIGYQGNFKYEYAYYDPFDPELQNYFYDQQLDWIDVTASDGKFCPEFSMISDYNCPANFRKIVYYTFRITNLTTGEVSFHEPYVYFGRCMTCNDGICRTIPVSEEDMKYSLEGNLLQKDKDGKILSVKNVKDIIK